MWVYFSHPLNIHRQDVAYPRKTVKEASGNNKIKNKNRKHPALYSAKTGNRLYKGNNQNGSIRETLKGFILN